MQCLSHNPADGPSYPLQKLIRGTMIQFYHLDKTLTIGKLFARFIPLNRPHITAEVFSCLFLRKTASYPQLLKNIFRMAAVRPPGGIFF